jgi:Holliday junction DNA helicase RuvA
MIARLKGLVVECSEEDATVDVAGVGYLVRCGAQTLGKLQLGLETVLHVEHTWSEAQGPRLYGFLSRDDRAVFVQLQTIQGVGPKAALSVLDVLPPADLVAAVARDDRTAVARANGVGPKLAARIVQELKGKPLAGGIAASTQPTGMSGTLAVQPSVTGEATAALMGLGYAEAQARRAVETILASEPEAELSKVIRMALRELGK